ncbi:hypothetical protein ACT6QG_12015 [Xanthobacter sp. TB0136]|uniref:hypothetical protein n=1 Tax=Xanthobacter sp. TB0136 TaxID=3459177 RepID=UPI004039E390
MSDILAFLIGGHWWPAVILLAGGLGFGAIALRFGLRPAVAWGIAAAALFVDQRAAIRGARAQREQDRADAERRAKLRERAAGELAQIDADELRRRAARWVRDNGGGAGDRVPGARSDPDQ